MSQIINNKEGALICVKLYPAVRYPFKARMPTLYHLIQSVHKRPGDPIETAEYWC